MSLPLGATDSRQFPDESRLYACDVLKMVIKNVTAQSSFVSEIPATKDPTKTSFKMLGLTQKVILTDCSTSVNFAHTPESTVEAPKLCLFRMGLNKTEKLGPLPKLEDAYAVAKRFDAYFSGNTFIDKLLMRAEIFLATGDSLKKEIFDELNPRMFITDMGPAPGVQPLVEALYGETTPENYEKGRRLMHYYMHDREITKKMQNWLELFDSYFIVLILFSMFVSESSQREFVDIVPTSDKLADKLFSRGDNMSRDSILILLTKDPSWRHMVEVWSVLKSSCVQESWYVRELIQKIVQIHWTKIGSVEWKIECDQRRRELA